MIFRARIFFDEEKNDRRLRPPPFRSDSDLVGYLSRRCHLLRAMMIPRREQERRGLRERRPRPSMVAFAGRRKEREERRKRPYEGPATIPPRSREITAGLGREDDYSRAHHHHRPAAVSRGSAPIPKFRGHNKTTTTLSRPAAEAILLLPLFAFSLSLSPGLCWNHRQIPTNADARPRV